MKKILHILLATAFVAGPLSAKTHADKTFLMPKSHNTNLAMEQSTWHKQIKKIDDNKFGGTFQAVPFYQESDNKKELGQYFGFTNKFANYRIDDFIWVDDNAWATHMYTNDIIHFYSVDAFQSTDWAAANLSDKIQFRPYQTSYGLRLDYHQKLDKFVDGLYFKVDAPIVHVKNSMEYRSIGLKQKQKLATDSDFTLTGEATLFVPANLVTGVEKGLEDYLTGNIVNSAVHANQVALNKYKIHNGKSETGVADVNVMLGYNFLYDNAHQASINIAAIIPTGNTPDGEYRFEPIVGNGGHWGIGGGVNIACELWKDNNKSIDFSLIVDYKYLFDSTEKRTLDFKHADTAKITYYGERASWGPYVLGGKKGDKKTTPLANFLTQDVKVTPGSQINALASVTFNCGKWSFDFGYELFAKEQEKVAVKSWANNTYGIAAWSWDTNLAFIDDQTDYTIYSGSDAVLANNTLYTINKVDLITGDAETPQQITQKVFGGFGYAFNDWKYPVMLGIGSSYEFASGNSALEGWAFWAKAGLTF